MCGFPSKRNSPTDADYGSPAACSGDCTGLMPTAPRDGDEWRSYTAMRSLMTSETSGAKGTR